MTLEGAESRIWCSKIGWQTVPCSWSIDSETALIGSSPGTRDQSQTPWNIVAGDHARSGPAYTKWGYVSSAVICLFVCFLT